MHGTERQPLTSEAIAEALLGLGDLAGPDGPSFELTAHDDRQRTVTVRVVLDAADCEDCVLPPAPLADLVTHHVRAAVGDCTVTVDDPRTATQEAP